MSVLYSIYTVPYRTVGMDPLDWKMAVQYPCTYEVMCVFMCVFMRLRKEEGGSSGSLDVRLPTTVQQGGSKSK